MDLSEIHQVFLRAAIECAQKGATARQMHEYLCEAARGMGISGAFGTKGDDLVNLLKHELRG